MYVCCLYIQTDVNANLREICTLCLQYILIYTCIHHVNINTPVHIFTLISWQILTKDDTSFAYRQQMGRPFSILMYIYILTYIYIYMYIYAYVFIYIYAHTHIYTHTTIYRIKRHSLFYFNHRGHSLKISLSYAAKFCCRTVWSDDQCCCHSSTGKNM